MDFRAHVIVVHNEHKRCVKICEFHNRTRKRIFQKLLIFFRFWCIIVEHDVRRCERLLTGGSEPCEVIFTEHVRKSGESMKRCRPHALRNLQTSARFAVFLRRNKEHAARC